MKNWNYRTIKTDNDGLPNFAIHTVYYDGNDKPIAYSETPAPICWSEGELPLDIFAQLKDALTKPALTPADFDQNPQTNEHYHAVLVKDQESGEWRGEIIGINGYADFYLQSLANAGEQARLSLQIFLDACARRGINPKK